MGEEGCGQGIVSLSLSNRGLIKLTCVEAAPHIKRFYMDTETRHFTGALARQAGPPFLSFILLF